MDRDLLLYIRNSSMNRYKWGVLHALHFTSALNHLLPLLLTSCSSLKSNIYRGQHRSKDTPSQYLMYNILPQMVFPPL